MLVICPSWGFIEGCFCRYIPLSNAGYRRLQWCSLLGGSRSRRYPESNRVAPTGKFITYCLFSVISTTFAAHYYFLFTPGGMPEGHAWNRYNPSVCLYIEHNRSSHQVVHAHS